MTGLGDSATSEESTIDLFGDLDDDKNGFLSLEELKEVCTYIYTQYV